MAQEPNLVSRSGSSNVSRRVKLAQVMTPTWCQEVAQVMRQEYGADPI